MKGTKRVTRTHPLTHSDPSRGPSPGLPLPGQPSPGLSSPRDHGSGSSGEPYWEPESLISADFLDDNPPESPQPITSHKHTNHLLIPPLLHSSLVLTSSPPELGSGSSCVSYWEPESLVSADFLERQTPGIPSTYIQPQPTHFPELVQTP